MNAKEKKSAVTTHIEQCDSIIKYCEDKGYRIITFEDENYPPLLRNIYNPPAVLFCMGNMENFYKPSGRSVRRNKKAFSLQCRNNRKKSAVNWLKEK